MNAPGSETLLTTRRLRLRRFRADDGALLADLDSDPEVMRYISRGQPTPRERIENEILPRLLAWYSQWPPRGFWAAHVLEDDAFVGWFHLRPDKIDPDAMELGYRLKRTAWGKGLATEGSLALIDRAFNEWDYAKISARTLVANLASRRVMEKCGLRLEREFHSTEKDLPGWTESERLGVKYSLSNPRPGPAGGF